MVALAWCGLVCFGLVLVWFGLGAATAYVLSCLPILIEYSVLC